MKWFWLVRNNKINSIEIVDEEQWNAFPQDDYTQLTGCRADNVDKAITILLAASPEYTRFIMHHKPKST